MTKFSDYILRPSFVARKMIFIFESITILSGNSSHSNTKSSSKEEFGRFELSKLRQITGFGFRFGKVKVDLPQSASNLQGDATLALRHIT